MRMRVTGNNRRSENEKRRKFNFLSKYSTNNLCFAVQNGCCSLKTSS